MRRRRDRLIALGLRIVLYLTIGWTWLALVLPGWLTTRLHQVAGEAVTIGQIRLGFPLQLILSDVQLASGNPGTVVSSDRVVVSPLWLWWPDKVVWLKRLELQGLHLQLRRTKEGALVQPVFEALLEGTSTQPEPSAAKADPATVAPSPWRVAIQTIQVSEGTIEFVDAKPPQPFRGALTHLFLIGGPVTIPLTAGSITLAAQGRVVGHQRLDASVYCSGWMDLQAKNVDVFCQLDPLRLAALQPYDQGPLEMRYDATLKATSHLVAQANALDGRVQLEVNNLSEADLAVLGKTLGDITNVKTLANGSQPALTGEIQISGSLDQPWEWRFQLVPGNDIVQRLVNPLLDRGIEIIRVRVGKQTIPVGLTPATEAARADSEATKQRVQEALQIIAPATSPVATPATSELLSEPTAATPELPASAEGPSPAPGTPPEKPADDTSTAPHH